jgi:kynurenine formamidase
MRRCHAYLAVASVLLTCLLLPPTALRGQGAATSRPPTVMSEAEYGRLFDELNNWGRWGADDRLGTINLITDARRREAARLVQRGISVSVAHNLSTAEAPDNPRPLQHVMAPSFRSDTLTFNYHGGFTTHIDALCHYLFRNRLYNDRPPDVSTAQGCFPGIEHFKDGIVTRGVLLDIPRLRGVPFLEPGTAIFGEEVEAWERQTGLTIAAGDAVLIRTGRWARRDARGPAPVLGNSAGFDVTMARWIKERDVAIVGGDVSVEVQTTPPATANLAGPLHTFLIAGLGMPILDNVDTEALAETAARLNRWEFLFVVAPLPVPGGTGSPVNPIAIF